MNEGSINGVDINATSVSAFQASIVVGSVAAIGVVRLIGFIRSADQILASASASGALGRMWARNVATHQATASIVHAPMVFARSVVAGAAEAVGAVSLHVQHAAVAVIALIERSIRRSPVVAQALADGTINILRMARSPLQASADASGAVVARSWVRHYIGEQFQALGVAVGVASGHVSARQPAVVSGTAIGTAAGFVLARSIVTGVAQAAGTVEADSYFSGPFDEPALPENTFVIPFDNNVFMVTEMPILGTKQQQPADRRDYDIDFSEWWPPDDYVVAATIAVAPVGPAVSRAFQGTVVKVWFNGGVSGTTYKVTIVATSNDGRIKEVELKMKVKEE